MAKIVMVLSSSDMYNEYLKLIGEIVEKKFTLTIINAENRKADRVLSETLSECDDDSPNVLLLVEEQYAKSMGINLEAHVVLLLNKDLTGGTVESRSSYLLNH